MNKDMEEEFNQTSDFLLGGLRSIMFIFAVVLFLCGALLPALFLGLVAWLLGLAKTQ